MIRALPILIIFTVIMMGTKLLELFEILPDFISARAIHASEEPAKDAKKEEKPKEEKKEDTKEESDKPKEEKKEEHGSEEKPKEGEHGAEGEKKPEDTPPPKSVVGPPSDFSPSEIEILQELARHREELDAREKDISLKENSLGVVEKNIDQKVETLKALQEQLKGIIAQYETKEDEKIKSLVKVYEAMKPQDASKIFEQLQMSVLIDVAVHMKEAKLAQILAKMDPYKAKELTTELANRRKIKSTE